MRIRDFLKENSETCASYKIPDSVLKEIGKTKKTEKKEDEEKAGPSTSQDNYDSDVDVEDIIRIM